MRRGGEGGRGGEGPGSLSKSLQGQPLFETQ